MGLFSNPYCHIYYRVSVNFWYIYPRSVCSEGKNEDLLHEVILIGGYFTVLNTDNQVIATKSLSGCLTYCFFDVLVAVAVFGS